jgi:hypothetical protein
MHRIEVFQGAPFLWYANKIGQQFDAYYEVGSMSYRTELDGVGAFLSPNDIFIVPPPDVPALCIVENFWEIGSDKLRFLLARDFAAKQEVAQFTRALLEEANVDENTRAQLKKNKRLPDYVKAAL